LALRRLPERRARLSGQIFRDAEGRRHQASQGAAGAVRAGCFRPRLLAEGPGYDRQPDRRTGGARIGHRMSLDDVLSFATQASLVFVPLFVPPSVLPDISPSRGEIGCHQWFRQSPTPAIGESQAASAISPLEGEMSGR